MRAKGAIALLAVAAVLAPSIVDASRAPTRGEDKQIRSAFRAAHYNTDDGVKLKSVRDVRVSTVDQRWASVIYKQGKGAKARAATATDYFFLKGESWKPRKKRQVPGAVAQDLKQPASPYLVTVRYAGSGTFTSNRDDGPGYTRQVTAAFNWDLTWEGVQLYDDHYPEYFDQPSSVAGGGTWSVNAEDPPCSASGALQLTEPVMREFHIDRGVDFFFRYPDYVSVGGCGYLDDIWGDAVASNLGNAYHPGVKDIPMFPERRIEIPIGSRPNEVGRECSDGDLAFPGECSLEWSGTVTITPPA